MTIIQSGPGAPSAGPGTTSRSRHAKPASNAGDGLTHLGPKAAAVAADPGAAWRTEPTNRKEAFAQRHGIDVASVSSELELDVELEKVIGAADFLPSRWLTLGAAAMDAVGRIRTQTSLGTGFLVAPWLLMTNNHVLDSVATADGSTVTFRFENDRDDRMVGTVKLALEPQRCFVTSVDLDFTLVAVASPGGDEPPGGTFGCIPAKGATGKILVGQPVNIVQHPDGRPREVAIRSNLLLTVDDATTLTYGTDTQPGSSGSPVLNDEWELVALHHASAPPTDAIQSNVGIRVSAIVAKVTQLADNEAANPGSAGTEAATLLGEFLQIGRTG